MLEEDSSIEERSQLHVSDDESIVFTNVDTDWSPNKNCNYSIAEELELRPPSNPKPSTQSTSLKTRLKNRLVLGWNKNNNINKVLKTVEPAPGGDLIDRSEVRGYGERQFDAHDASEYEPSSYGNFLNYQTGSSIGNLSSVAGRNIPQGSTSIAPPSMFKAPKNVSPLRSNFSALTNDSKKKQRAQSSAQQSGVNTLSAHLTLSSELKQHGPELVSNKMVFQGTDFCYLQSESDDHYRFSIMESVPDTIRSSQYTTMSKHGILRSVAGTDSELVSYPEFARENQLYYALRRIRLFGQFRLWKSVKVWRTNIAANRFRRTVRTILWIVCNFASQFIFSTVL